MARYVTYRGFILRAEADREGMSAWTSTVDVRPEGSRETNGKQFAPPTPRSLFYSEAEAQDVAIEWGKAMVRSGHAV